MGPAKGQPHYTPTYARDRDRRELFSEGKTCKVVDQWSTQPVTNDVALRLLRVAYRRPLGIIENLYTIHSGDYITPRNVSIIEIKDSESSDPNVIVYRGATSLVIDQRADGIRDDRCEVYPQWK